MGRKHATSKSQAAKSTWRWKYYKTASFRNKNRETKEKTLQKAQKGPLSSSDITKLSRNVPNFLGVFASDQIPLLRFIQCPIFLIANIDSVSQIGSHWIAIRLGKRKIEIFDSLGFHPSLWTSYPRELIDWLKNLSLSHKIYVSSLMQEPNTYHCGLYALFFIVARQFHSFSQCCAQFSRNYSRNSEILYNFFK